MKNIQGKNYLKRTQKDYSLAFKLQVIDEIEKGCLTYKESQKKYGIQGRSTVLVWLRKHGTLDWKSKVPMKDKQPPKKVISQLEARIKRLEAEKEILNRAIDIADNTLNTEIRKKYLPLSEEASRRQRGRTEYSIRLIASTLGYSRQYYYKQQADMELEQAKKLRVRILVEQQRKLLPRLGTRKLYYLIKAKLEAENIKFGRDKLFALLSEHGLLIKPKRRYVQTTMSRHYLRKWPNIIRNLEVSQPDQLWVSDITYIKTEEGNCYLNMITDAFSRKIVGYAIDATMETTSMINALKMATAQKVNLKAHTIHHSDRGLQYCSRKYVTLTAKHNIRLSMTENSDPYENAMAERMNRSIKEEFGINRKLRSKEQAMELVRESIDLYNAKRPHLSLGMRVPNQVYKNQNPDNKMQSGDEY